MKIQGITCKGTFNPYGKFVIFVTEKDGQTRAFPYENALAKECWHGVITHVCMIQLVTKWQKIHQVECY